MGVHQTVSSNDVLQGPRYQNTYKLDSSNPFNAEKVDKILQEVMHEIIDNLHYDPEKCSSTAKYASMQIRSKVKQLEFDRYVSSIGVNRKILSFWGVFLDINWFVW